MDKRFKFFSSSLIFAILVSRLWNFILGNASLYLWGVQIHHLYVGVLIVMFAGFSGFFLDKDGKKFYDLVLFGFGSGLVVDEMFFLVFTPGTHRFYFKPVSFYGALVFAGFSLFVFYLIYYEEE